MDSEEGRMLADENKCTFMEVSAKENINIEQMFNQLAMSIASEIKEELTMNKSNSGGEGKLSILVNQPKANKECCN